MAEAVVPLWVTLIGFAAPLLALAGSAVAFVIKGFQEAADRRHNQLFELMALIDDQQKPLASKLAAVYRLRRFHSDREFIVRFCRTVREQIVGQASDALVRELDATAEAMSRGG